MSPPDPAPSGAFDPANLELTSAAMRHLVEEAMARIVAHVEGLDSAPAAVLDARAGAALADRLAEPLPRTPTPIGEVLDLLFHTALPHSFGCAGPGFLAYVPGGGLFQTAVADLVADTINRYVTVFEAAPGLARIETNVVRWLADMVGYPAGALGVLTSGGSIANLSAIVAAREAHLGEDFTRAALYVSDQIHHSIPKAARLAGLPAASVRVVATDARRAIRIDALEATIAADRAAGRRPFLIVASAGTTNTGAVDDLSALADVTAAETAAGRPLWLHADAAYGGFFVLSERGRAVLAGLDRCDSITLDPHKGLSLPFGTGCLLVRRAEDLRRTFRETGDYMPGMQEEADLEHVDFHALGPELSREFRGLRLWLPLKLHGLDPFVRHLEEKFDLARLAARELAAMKELEVVTDGPLSIVTFRVARGRAGETDEETDDEVDARTLDVLERVNRKARVFLTGTRLEGRPVVRLCILSFRTHEDRIRMALEDIREAARRTLA